MLLSSVLCVICLRSSVHSFVRGETGRMTSSRKDPYRALHGGARRIGSPNLAGIRKAPFDPAQAVAAGSGRGGVDSGRPTFGRRPERRADGTLRLLRRLGRSVSFVAIIHPPPTDTVRFRGIASNRGAGEECLGGRAVREASASGEAERQGLPTPQAIMRSTPIGARRGMDRLQCRMRASSHTGSTQAGGDPRQTSAQGSQGAHFARQKHPNEAKQGEANPALRP